MKRIHILLILIVIVGLTVISCSKKDPVRFMPYGLSYFHCHSNVKSIVEKEYSNNSKLINTIVYNFDELGRINSSASIQGQDTIRTVVYTYSRNGRIHNIQGIDSISYTPVYNEFGDLIKELYVTGGSGDDQQGYYTEFSYDSLGNLSKESLCYFRSECYVTEYAYNNLKQTNYTTSGSGEEIEGECDSAGNVIIEKVFEDEPRKLTGITNFSYIYDEQGNWIEKVAKVKKKTKSITKREIAYYPTENTVPMPPAVDGISSSPVMASSGWIIPYVEDIKSRLAMVGYTSGSPNDVLLLILLIATAIIIAVALFFFQSEYGLFNKFTGYTLSNGMKRLWMYNKEPYLKIGGVLLISLAAFVISILIIFLVGGIAWVVFWIIKLALLAIIVIGWIALIVGIIGLLAKEPYGCLPLILGGIVVIFQDPIKAAGDTLVNWGFQFMQSVNMFDWGINLFTDFWDIILVAFFSPMALFLTFALFIITLDLLLIGFEFIVTRIYSIRRPCPTCGGTVAPEYMVKGKAHPVPLRPGLYGVFYQKSPHTSEALPTMLINGRGKLIRKCKKCGSIIKADAEKTFGTEIHIGFVGHRSSGKSYLLYSGLSLLQKQYSDRISQIDADNDTKIENKKQRIDAREGIQTNESNKYRAVQLILKNKFRPVPYHLFFYDVAGEKFNYSSNSHKTAMDFYCNVQSIVFILDPCMIDYTGMPASPKLLTWVGDRDKQYNEKYKVEGSFSVLKDILETVGHKSKRIDLNFVCTKTDIGYFGDLGYATANISDADIERFVCMELGLVNLVNSAKAAFKSVNFFAVSAVSKDTSSLSKLFVDILKQRDVNM